MEVVSQRNRSQKVAFMLALLIGALPAYVLITSFLPFYHAMRRADGKNGMNPKVAEKTVSHSEPTPNTNVTLSPHQNDGYKVNPLKMAGTAALDRFLVGPGLKTTSSGQSTTAGCEWVRQKHSEHFPHAMQQLYRCFSWWMANPTKEPYLVSNKQNLKSPFMTGFISSLREVFNVTIVESTGSLQVVQATRGSMPYNARSPEDLHYLRDKTLAYYNITLKGGGCSSSPGNDHRNFPRIGILNRLTRTIPMVKELELNISEALGVPVTVFYFEGRTYLEQVQLMAETDILISPHGAQLTSLPFMPNCGAVLEIFPVGYYIPYFFGSLAASSGLSYYRLYTGKNHTAEDVRHKGFEARVQARKMPVTAAVDVVVDGVKQMKANWDRCCLTGTTSRP